MIFKSGHHGGGHKKGGGPFGLFFGIFRLFLSLIVMGVLVLGMYQAYKSFSGVDPLTASPNAILANFLASEDAYALINNLFTANPTDSLEKAKELLKEGVEESTSVETIPTSSVSFKFAILADSHNDNASLAKALSQAKENGAEFVIGLGDYTNVGTIDELVNSKKEFDIANITYYSTAGDHDLWDARNRNLDPIQNYTEVFGTPYKSFGYKNVRFLIMYNADNYLGVGELQKKWLRDELENNKNNQQNPLLVFTAVPLYHPSSDHQMGKTTPKLKVEAEELTNMFASYGVDEVIAGDTHFFARYTEPKNNLKMTSIGAVTSERNAQSPRYVMVDVYEDGGYNIQNTEIR